MANTIEFYLRASENSDYLERFMKEISTKYAFGFSKLNSLEYVFSSNPFDLEKLSEISQISESKITLVYYNTSLGYARKRKYEYGYLTSNKAVTFSLDIESQIYDYSEASDRSFEELLESYIDKNGIEEIDFPKVGDFIKINENICSDNGVLSWLENQNKNEFKVTAVELQSDGLWIEDCDYRIDISECELVI